MTDYQVRRRLQDELLDRLGNDFARGAITREKFEREIEAQLRAFDRSDPGTHHENSPRDPHGL